MTKVHVGIGTNINRGDNIRSALDELSDTFGELLVSTVYESNSVNCDENPYYNLVVEFNTFIGISDLISKLQLIEEKNGRVRNSRDLRAITLDLDLLTYGNSQGEVEGVMLPRRDIVLYSFVLRPLQDIAPFSEHPEYEKTYRYLWRSIDFHGQRLWPVDFSWRGKKISRAKKDIGRLTSPDSRSLLSTTNMKPSTNSAKNHQNVSKLTLCKWNLRPMSNLPGFALDLPLFIANSHFKLLPIARIVHEVLPS